MSIIDIIEEIVMTYELCAKQPCEITCDDMTNVVKQCPHMDACNSVFYKKNPITEIEELAAQCKAFNEFARANRKG